MSSREIRIPLDELVGVLRDLDESVVSLDRPGSRQASGTADEHTVGTFVADWRVAPRPSHARGVIGAALDAQLSEAENLAIDDLGEQGRSFGDRSGPRRRP
ncbi:hypothetical protein [Streptomyces sp. Wb2n-11]|uniref:hypothetical protein n=1 Tax=Streptomyces sp. Wb2n-11 TaxID=1030533 RepID=UPI000A904916|nr:hypothetical protein [Streptomyces sp. Wb2n-11]